MQRTNIIQLKPSKKQIIILKEMMLLSSCVYNMTNYIVRQKIINGEKVPSFFDLQKELQVKEDYKLLGRSYSLPRIQIYSETNSARFKLIKSKTQKRVGLPLYLKNRKTNTTLPSYLVIDNCQYSIGKKKVLIPLSRQMRKKYLCGDFRIEYNGILKHKGEQLRGQIHFKNNKFYLYQSVEVKEPNKTKSEVVAGLDIGQKKYLALLTNKGQEKIIGSSRFFRQWEYFTNLIAKEQQKLSAINRKSSNNLSNLYAKRTTYQDNLFNNIIAKMFRFLKRNKVSFLFVGDLNGIRDENDKGKKLNQMTHNYWSFDKLLHKIENKAEEFGIKIHMTTEEYTSRTCPVCFDSSKQNKKDRIFHCTFCGYTDHRDIVGARNIMLKGMHDLLIANRSNQSVHWCETAPYEVL